MRLLEDFLDTPNTTEDDLISSNSSSDSSYRPIESYHAIFSISCERLALSGISQEDMLKKVVRILQRYGFESETSEVVVMSINGRWDKPLWSDGQQHELSSSFEKHNKSNITNTLGNVFSSKYICWFGIDWKFKTLTRLYNFANQLCKILDGNPYHRVYVYSKQNLNNLGINLTNIMDAFDDLMNGVHNNSNHFTYGYQEILHLCQLLLDRDDILKHVTEVSKGYSLVNKVIDEAQHRIADDTKFHQGNLKRDIELTLPDDIIEMLSTTGISLDYLFEKVEKTSDKKEKLPHIYVYLRKTFTYLMRFINTKEVRIDVLKNVAPDMNFRMIDNKYNLFKYYKDQAKQPYHLLTIYGGYFKDKTDECQYYVVLGIMFSPKQQNFIETIRNACKASLPKEKLNEDFIGDMSQDEIISTEINDVKEDKIEDYQYYVGINIKDSKKTPDEVRRNLHNGLRRIRGIKAISELQVEPMRINNDTVNWKYPLTRSLYDDAIRFGMDADFRLVKEVIMFLVILHKSTDSTVRPEIVIYNNESGRDAGFTKYNELYRLLLDKKENVSSTVEQRIDRAYREVLMAAMFFNQYKPDSFWQLRRTFDRFDDLIYFWTRFTSEMKSETSMDFQLLSYDSLNYKDPYKRYNITMPRQELANDVLLFNNYFERIADVRSPGGINRVNGNLMKILPENVVIEKIVRGQYGAQKRTFGYYIIISFKPVMIGVSLKYAAILLFSHDKHQPVDDLYKKILSYQNND